MAEKNFKAAVSLRSVRAASKKLELRSLESASIDLDEARQNFESLSMGEQLNLAQHTAEARKSEYTRLVTNVVAVTAGLRRQRDAYGHEHIHPSPCVVFVVRTKPSKAELRHTPPQVLPQRLITSVLTGGTLKHFSIPVDVQLQDRLLSATAQADTAVFARSSQSGRADFGTVTCVVVDGAGTRYAMAPIHVLSPYPVSNGRGISAAAAPNVFRVASAASPPDSAPFLRSTVFGGRLAPEPLRSFDVQLAAIADRHRLSAAFSGVNLSRDMPYVGSIVELGNLLRDGRRMEILVPNNHPDHLGTLRTPPQATLSLVDTDQTIWYQFSSQQQPVLHNVLELQLVAGDSTNAGDSGSAVVIPGDDSSYRFVGMHIAGNKSRRTSFVIPAWKLLNGLEYASVGGAMPPGGLDLAASF